MTEKYPANHHCALQSILHNALDVHYIYGCATQLWQPHQEKHWRSLPYTTIVTREEEDARYAAEIKDRGVIEIGSGCSFVIPSGTAFRLHLDKPARLGNAHIAFHIMGHMDVLSCFDFPCLVEGESSAVIRRLVNELASCDKADALAPLHRLIRMQHLMLELLEALISQRPMRKDAIMRLSGMERLSPAIHYINDHLSESLTRSQLAQTLHLSPTRFHYVFKDAMGVSPMTYLTQQRMQRAQELLLSTCDSVACIASQVGIPNASYFSKLFRQHFHVTPLSYRQRGLLPAWSDHHPH